MTAAVLVLASLLTVAENIGYPLIFLIVMIETGCGIPFAPGEIATVTGGIAASDGKLQIEAVIAVAAAGAIVGDNIGYVIGRLGGRRLLETPRGPFARQRRAVIRVGDPFFERHGAKAVFWGRWLPVLRVYASWMAGGSRMPWRTFVFWNAAGGICWATSIGLAGYIGGKAAKHVMEDLGAYGLILVPIGLVAGYLFYRSQQRRLLRSLDPEDEAGERRAAPAEPPA
jgi:membrane protein DedA with SNARE-associated domain